MKITYAKKMSVVQRMFRKGYDDALISNVVRLRWCGWNRLVPVHGEQAHRGCSCILDRAEDDRPTLCEPDLRRSYDSVCEYE